MKPLALVVDSEGGYVRHGPHGRVLFLIRGQEVLPIARQVCSRVNSHDELAQHIETLATALQSACLVINDHLARTIALDMVRAARDTLAKVQS